MAENTRSVHHLEGKKQAYYLWQEPAGAQSGIAFGEGSEVHVGDNVLLERDVRISTGANARVYIGDNSYLGDGCNLLAVKELRIGKNCSISWHVLFMDTSSHPGFCGGNTRDQDSPHSSGRPCLDWLPGGYLKRGYRRYWIHYC